jgi:hypothetical protein
MCHGARVGLHGGNDNAKLGLGFSMGPSPPPPLPYNTLTRDSLQDHHNERIPTFSRIRVDFGVSILEGRHDTVIL